MADQDEDLWPTAFTTTVEEPFPVVLLRRQAELLSGKTNGQVEGVVQYGAVGGTDYYSLYFRSPSLGDYMFKILNIALPVTWSPATPFPITAEDSFGAERAEIADENEFKDWLRRVFSSEPVIAVVKNMMRRAERLAAHNEAEGD